MKSRLEIILVLATVLGFYGCGNYEQAKQNLSNDQPNAPLVRSPEGGGGEESGPEFQDVFAQVIEPRCLSCHLNYSQYSAVINRIDEILRRVAIDDMPRSGPALSSEQKNLLRTWVDLGATEQRATVPDDQIDEPGRPDEEDLLVPTWSSVSQKIFFAKCTVCHSPNGVAKFLDLSQRQKIFEKRKTLVDFDNPSESYLIEVITDPIEPMPPPNSGLQGLNSNEVEVLIEWIRLGLP